MGHDIQNVEGIQAAEQESESQNTHEQALGQGELDDALDHAAISS
ncbi:MAG: hypothetical protein U0361_17355 [Nitrospiraceae bacterium]